MEILQNQRCASEPDVLDRLAGSAETWLDLGTGDGRFVLRTARSRPETLVIGLDACRENLREAVRMAPLNALFVIANACALPQELYGCASRVTINFPWGSLLRGLLEPEPGLLNGLRAVMRPGARLAVRLNASALSEAGWGLAAGGEQIQDVLANAGFKLRAPQRLDAAALRACDSTWAKRMAFGRCPEGLLLNVI